MDQVIQINSRFTSVNDIISWVLTSSNSFFCLFLCFYLFNEFRSSSRKQFQGVWQDTNRPEFWSYQVQWKPLAIKVCTNYFSLLTQTFQHLELFPATWTLALQFEATLVIHICLTTCTYSFGYRDKRHLFWCIFNQFDNLLFIVFCFIVNIFCFTPLTTVFF